MFTFKAPDKLLNLNDRMHWAKRAKMVRCWREAAFFAAQQLPRAVRPVSGRVLIEVVLPVKNNRRRDAHNFVATLKPIIDGMVDARVVDDDDVTRVMTVEPMFHVSEFVVVTVSKVP